MNIYYDIESNCYRTYPDGDKANDNQIKEMVEGKKLSIIKLQQENQELKDNWNKLKEFVLKKQAVLFNTEYTCYSNYSNILDKMQELEQGSNSDE